MVTCKQCKCNANAVPAFPKGNVGAARLKGLIFFPVSCARLAGTVCPRKASRVRRSHYDIPGSFQVVNPTESRKSLPDIENYQYEKQVLASKTKRDFLIAALLLR